MLRIVGDINLTDGYFDTGIGVGSALQKRLDPFAHLARRDEDFWIGNMECVCADVSCHVGLKAKQFIASPSSLDHVSHLEFYGVANNHVMQHGAEAYQAMLAYLDEKGVAYAGANSKRSHVFDHQGKRVAIIAFCQRPDNFTQSPLYWHMPEWDDIRAEIRAHADCDYRVAFVHWGNEFISYPYIDQKQFAHALVDSGVNLVVGMHPHVAQGCEQYRGQWIFYSLGNFVFNMPWEPTKYGLVVNVDLAAEPSVGYDYVRIGDDFCPKVCGEVPQEYGIEHLNALLSINEENEKYYAQVRRCNKQYRQVNRRDIVGNFLKMNPRDSWGIVADFLKRRL